jgi:transglutaminase-like putative cysteine protease
MHGAFYYHAWPEVYITEGPSRAESRGAGRGLWLPVDPTLNQFPADATHLRLARGGLDRQAVILPLIGRLKVTVTGLELDPTTDRVIVGRQAPAPEAPAFRLDDPRNAPPEAKCRCSNAGASAAAALGGTP